MQNYITGCRIELKFCITMASLNFDATKAELSSIINCVNGCEYSDLSDGNISSDVLAIDGDRLLNVLHLNIRSLHKNLDSLLMLLHDLRDKNVVIHVIALCETFLNRNTLSLIDIENYTGFHRIRDSGVGGGVSIYVHDSVKFIKQIDSPFTDCFESILLELNYYGKKIMLSEFYHIPNTDVQNFMHSFRQLADSVSKEHFCVLCSDHNLDFLKSECHKLTREFVNFLNDQMFITCILKPTRVTHATSTLIDNIFVKSSSLNEFKSYVLVDHMSDHYPCFVSYKLKGVDDNNAEIMIKKRKLNEPAIHRVCEELLFFDWTPIYGMTVDESYSFLTESITHVLDRISPRKIIKIRACDKFREPWLTVQLRKYNTKCRKLCKKARNSGSDDDTSKYRMYRNTLVRLKSHVKREYYESLFKKIGKNSYLLWNVVNNIVRKTSNKNDITEIDYEGIKCTTKSSICDVFNKHFATAGTKVSTSISGNPDNKKPALAYVKQVTNNFLLSPVSESYICRIVKGLKPKRSTGYDDISNALLQQLIHVIKLPLAVVFNKSIQFGIYPDLMKLAKVIPLHKGGLSSVPDNYRPISLLPVLSKVLERIIYEKLVAHLDANDVLYPKQFGFRKHHSTTDAILCLFGDLLPCLDRKSMLVSIFIDLKKAFDTVPHELILAKLEKIGVRDTELCWFKSYMNNRRQFVQIGNSKSEVTNMRIGVQQGSLLGVLLFQLLINDLPQCLKFSCSILYADDTTIFVHGKSLRFLRTKLQADLDNLSNWLLVNGLKLNVSKTKVMVFEAQGLTPNIALEIDGQMIENVTSFKFLGLNVCADLSFKSHLCQIRQRLSQAIFILRKLAYILPLSCLRTLYYAYFHSHLSYCMIIWFPLLTSAERDSLYKMQKRAVRIISGAKPLQHCMPFFKKEDIVTVHDQVLIENCRLVHRVVNKTCPSPLIFMLSPGNRNAFSTQTRSGSLNIPAHTSAKLNSSFLCQAIMDWSKLGKDVINSEHSKLLSRKIKTNMLKKY